MISLDTNILVYVIGVERDVDDRQKVERARALMAALRGRARLAVAAQALAELHFFLMRNGWPREDIQNEIARIQAYAVTLPCSVGTFDNAVDLATTRQLQIFDAMILSATADAGLRWLLSEDMQDGFSWRAVEIVNPLAAPIEATLVRLGIAS